MKMCAVFLSIVGCCFSQQVDISNVTLPAGIAVFGEFNQLGAPRFTGGVAAVYPVSESMGIYGTTSTEFFPQLKTDPSTGKSFYAFSASVRQEFHKRIFSAGRFMALGGGGVGPSLSQGVGAASSITVNLSTSAVATAVLKLNGRFALLFPLRMLYVAGAGWNPILGAGLMIWRKNRALLQIPPGLDLVRNLQECRDQLSDKGAQ